jgi:hypothetical protein
MRRAVSVFMLSSESRSWSSDWQTCRLARQACSHALLFVSVPFGGAAVAVQASALLDLKRLHASRHDGSVVALVQGGRET